MYPAQTSFIPVQVALARWLSEQGWLEAWKSNYPYWYLGSTPYKYLTGPVMPGLLIGLKKLLPGLNWFELMWLVMGVSLGMTMLGVYWLVRELGGEKRLGGLAAGLMAMGWFYGWSFPITDGVSWLGFSGLILSLTVYTRWLRKQNWQRAIFLITCISFVLLINSLIVPSLGLGMVVVLLSWGKWKQVEKRLKASVMMLVIAGLLVSGWYGLGYWRQLLLAPSLAGKTAFKVMGQLLRLLPMVVAVSAAVIGERWLKLKGRLNKFWFYWLMIFGWLSVFRLIADPDFWIDWVAYGLELQLGMSLMVGKWLMGKRKGLVRGLVIGLWIVVWLGLVQQRVVLSLRTKTELEKGVEHQLGQWLSQKVKATERVFLSGSTVFWLNAWFDVAQVRGGADQAAVNQEWQEAVWEVRQGKKVEKALDWLERLGIDWLVVHGAKSEDYYKDFKYADKFEKIKELKKVYDQGGDRVYAVEIK